MQTLRKVLPEMEKMREEVVPVNENKTWYFYISEDLPRTIQESTDFAIRSARSIQNTSSTHIRTLQDFMPKIKVQYGTYEEVLFKKIKEKAVQGADELFTFLCLFYELVTAREHPAMAGGIGIAAGLSSCEVSSLYLDCLKKLYSICILTPILIVFLRLPR
ncbi:hypothetical protein RND71_002080 [Anisodus tanguticus]|uniref:Uncharacterized protein n=1 Tax=Anisodus tanguticus TaxID=243964 RepID=A0AAE1SZ59_9SOLA|nr:hypothetical protein RND71_002080 [Anisodus tanguticus]